MPDSGAVLAGVMSGTSLDGVTAAIARFRERDHRIVVELLGVETVRYTDAMRERLAAAMSGGHPREYSALAFQLGGQLATAAAQVIASAGVARADIAAIASHGHTIWHEPPAGTWQLGEGAVIAERLGIQVIEDFRVRDVAGGGQGAPLVPIADALLFGNEKAPRALLNIGGMANVTIVPRLGETAGVRAFDTGPGVVLIDALANALLGERFDPGGGFARSGAPIAAVVDAQLAHEFFRREPPKSTGRETFNDAYAMALIDSCRAAAPECTDADILATATELTARTIVNAFERFIPDALGDVLVSGGGAMNEFLMERLRSLLAVHRSTLAVTLFEEAFFPGEAKEAVAFAFLGFLHLRGRPGNIPGATGARGPRILGKRIPA